MKHIIRTLALPIAVAATLVLAACGTEDSHGGGGVTTGAAATGAKNAADVVFASDMIPHHAQAVEMADIALKQATDSKVKALAGRIKEAQGPEISRMSGWLAGWGEPVPGTGAGHEMTGMGETGGMMSAQEMTDLGKATGSSFDRMWLQMMVRHHQGAVAAARTALAGGTNPASKTLAQSIIETQSAEITEISSILAGLPG